MRPRATLRFIRELSENADAIYSVQPFNGQILTQPVNLCNARASVRDLCVDAWVGVSHSFDIVIYP